jgi:hypothetical protein
MATDERIKKSSGDDKAERAMDDRTVTENRELTDQERAEYFRASFSQTHLPNLPMQPGYHLCWLTTTNPNDSISGRLRLGYELIRAKDVPGFESNFVVGGQFDGCVGVNEMIAARIPERIYNMYMRISHHEKPLEEESRMNATAEMIKEEAAKRGLKVKEGEEADGSQW